MAAPTFVPTRSVAPLVLLALLALAPLGAAQIADPSVSVSAAAPALELGAANTTTLAATVTNQNPNAGGNVVVQARAPEGWTVVADPIQFPLAAGASQTVTLTLVAPDAGEGAATGDLVLSAAITESLATARTASASASVALTRVDPVVVPPPPVPWYATAAGIAGIVAAVLAVAGAAAFVLARRRRERLAREAAEAERAAYLARETGITLQRVDAPRPYGPRRDYTFRVAVTNASERPRVATLRVELPDGWTGAPQVPRLPLSPGERAVVTVCVGAGASVPPDSTARVEVVARPEEARERDERVAVDVTAASVRLTPEGDVHIGGLRGPRPPNPFRASQ